MFSLVVMHLRDFVQNNKTINFLAFLVFSYTVIRITNVVIEAGANYLTANIGQLTLLMTAYVGVFALNAQSSQWAAAYGQKPPAPPLPQTPATQINMGAPLVQPQAGSDANVSAS